MSLTPPTSEAPDEQADLRTLEEAGTVLVQLDAVEVTLPLHSPLVRRLLAWMLVSPMLVLLIGSMVALATSFIAALVLLTMGLVFLPVAALLWMALQQGQTRLRMTDRHLHTASRQIALDDIQGVTYRYSEISVERRGMLEVALRDERIDIPVPDASAGPALVRLIRRHVERRQLALEAAGHDTSQPARPPEALLALQRDRQSGGGG